MNETAYEWKQLPQGETVLNCKDIGPSGSKHQA